MYNFCSTWNIVQEHHSWLRNWQRIHQALSGQNKSDSLVLSATYHSILKLVRLVSILFFLVPVLPVWWSIRLWFIIAFLYNHIELCNHNSCTQFSWLALLIEITSLTLIQNPLYSVSVMLIAFCTVSFLSSVMIKSPLLDRSSGFHLCKYHYSVFNKFYNWIIIMIVWSTKVQNLHMLVHFSIAYYQIFLTGLQK